MPDPLLDTLPLPQRLALSYASGSAREAALTLFALDAKLAQAIRQQREPALAQIRLAWWRELLAKPAETRPPGDPLIDGLAIWQGEEGALTELVDGWENLIADENLSSSAIAGFAKGRASAFAGLQRLLCAGNASEDTVLAGTRWALADLASGLSDPAEREETLTQACKLGGARAALPRELRALAVLDGLARHMIASRADSILSGPTSMLRVLRIGVFGR